MGMVPKEVKKKKVEKVVQDLEGLSEIRNI